MNRIEITPLASILPAVLSASVVVLTITTLLTPPLSTLLAPGLGVLTSLYIFDRIVQYDIYIGGGQLLSIESSTNAGTSTKNDTKVYWESDSLLDDKCSHCGQMFEPAGDTLETRSRKYTFCPKCTTFAIAAVRVRDTADKTKDITENE